MSTSTTTKWREYALGDVADIVTGATPSTKIKEYFGGDVPFATPSDLDGNGPIGQTSTSLTNLGASQVRIIPPGSVLVCCIGSLGKVGFAGRELATNQQINSLVFDKSRVVPRYGYHFCRTLKPLLEHMAPATTVAIVNKTKFSRLKIPLPPLSEQKRIADILDKADIIRRKRQEIASNLVELEKSLFEESFAPSIAGHDEWPLVSLDDVLFFQEGPGVRKWQFTDSGVKLLNVGNIVKGSLHLNNTERYLSEDETFGKYQHFLVQAGDLVMATSGVTWGKTAWVEEEHLPLCMNTSTVRFRPLDENRVTKSYMHAFLKSRFFTRQVDKLVTGSAQPNFGPSHLKQVQIVIPDIESQIAYDEKLKLLAAINQRQRHGTEDAEHLFNSLVQRAFKGEL